MMEQFGVSKPTLREALRVLETDGLVKIVRGRQGGIEILAPGTDSLAHALGLLLQSRGTSVGDLYDLRVILESGAPLLLAERMDLVSALDPLAALADFDSSRKRGQKAGILLGHAFHTELIRLTGNRALILFTEIVEKVTETASLEMMRVARRTSAREAAIDHALADHVRLVKLLRTGDFREAQRLWHDHLVEARTGVLNQELSKLPATVYGKG
jgi:DNA-binding FadR family transcriptional regulator